MSVGNRVKQTAIWTLVTLLGNKDTFPRIVEQMKKVNEKYPEIDGDAKKKIVVADLKIIFNDLVVPIARSVINLLIELGVVYLTTQITKENK